MAIINSNPYSYWQWDVGQVFTIPKEYCTFKFLIQNEGSTKSYVSVATTNDQENYEVPIPNIVLQTAGRVLVYYCNGDIVFETEEVEGETITTIQNLRTVAEQVLWVNKRGKPENYIYTPEDLVTYDGLSYQINELKDRCQAIEDNIEYNSRSIENLKAVDTSLNKRISNIEQHINQDYFITDDSIAYTKEVPANVCTYAQLNSIGGMTYKCDNLLKIIPPNNNPWIQDSAECKFDNGMITVNSSIALARTVTFTFETEIELVAGEDYWVSSGQSNTSTTTWRMYITPTVQGAFASKYTITDKGVSLGTISANTGCKIYIQVYAGAQPKNIVFIPTISYASISSDGTPYFEGLRDTKVTKIISHGVNLFNEETLLSHSGVVIESDFIKLPNSRDTIITDIFKDKTAYTFSLSCYRDSNNYKWLFEYTDGTKSTGEFPNSTEAFVKFTSDATKTVKRIITSFGETGGYGWIRKGTVMLNEGVEALPYKPYREPITYTIPEALQGTGKGVAGYNDTVDFENGKYVKRCYTLVLNGSEDWQEWTSGTMFYYIRPPYDGTSTTGRNLICSHFDYGASYQNQGFYVQQNVIRAYITLQFPTLDEWKAYLAKQYNNGTPVTLTYALAEPIETDLTENFDNILEVEVGGQFEFVNEYKNAVPSSITYLKKEGSI